jgi:hypothetical protein
MSRHGFHSFTSDAPTFGCDLDFIDPFYSADPAATPRKVPRAAEASLSSPLSRRAPGFIHEKEPN